MGCWPSFLENPGRELHHLAGRLLAAAQSPALITRGRRRSRRRRRRSACCEDTSSDTRRRWTADSAAGAADRRPGRVRSPSGTTSSHCCARHGNAACSANRTWRSKSSPPSAVWSFASGCPMRFRPGWSNGPPKPPGPAPAPAPNPPHHRSPTALSPPAGGCGSPAPTHCRCKTDHPADPLRPLLGALSGIEDNQAAVHSAARPAGHRPPTRTAAHRGQTPPARGAVQTRPARAGAGSVSGQRTGRHGHQSCQPLLCRRTALRRRHPAPLPPTRPLPSCRRRCAEGRRTPSPQRSPATAASTNSPAAICARPVPQLAGRRLGRGQLMSVAEVAALAHLPLDATVPGLTRAGVRVAGQQSRRATPPPSEPPATSTTSPATFDDGDSTSFPSGPLTSTAMETRAGLPHRPSSHAVSRKFSTAGRG